MRRQDRVYGLLTMFTTICNEHPLCDLRTLHMSRWNTHVHDKIYTINQVEIPSCGVSFVHAVYTRV
jgi:hypothetical protein